MSLGAVATAGCQTIIPARSQTDVTRKQVLRIGGEPAIEAEVRIIDVSESDSHQSFPVDSNGRVELPVNSIEDNLLLAAEQRQGENKWIGVRPDFHGVEPFESNQQITLNQELIFGPTRGGINTAVSFWRWIDPGNPNRQTLYIELVDVRTRVGVAPWEIDKLEVDRGAPEEAIFSLTLPEQVFVGYTEGDLDEQVHVVELRDEDTVIQWHSLRDPAIPIRTVPLADQEYEVFTKSDEEQRQRFQERRNRLADMIFDNLLGAVPIPGTEALGLVNGFFGSMIEQVIEDSGSIGDSFADPDSFERPSRNTHDLISRGYFSRSVQSPAVCFGVPVRFESDRSDPVRFIAEAEWEAGAGSFRFGKQLEVNTSSEPDNGGGNTVNGTWAMFQADAANTGVTTTTGPTADVIQQWRFQTGDPVTSSPAVVDGTVYVGNSGGTLYALNASDGTEQWRFSADNELVSSPAVAGNTVYIGNREHFDSSEISFYAIDAETGSIRWQTKAAGGYSTPTVLDGTVYVGSVEGVFALDTAQGTERWHFETDRFVNTVPAILDGTVYVGSLDHYVYAIQVSDGTERWRFETGGPISNSSPAVANNTVYIGSGETDTNVYAIDTEQGTEQWRFQTTDGVFASPAINENTVYVGGRDGRLSALEASSGREQWSFQTGDSVDSSPAIAGETVYLGSGDGNVYAVSTDDGTERWNFETDGWISSSPAVVDRTVCVGSADGNVYSLGVNSR
ncbi:outer membrane protein assembly factor BamB family protein [Halorarum salinum]|uniref:PQQ-like beta-propeller repeat protein n=1 Tax=Halorarum salinum TaxID=2743089 RepID=A0A7D5QBQ7_9EURY|nr:PQQ-binding-like beta-propeller repeat protein [Halobaculum salinum]QLG62040.1 PQQ-like beta-propeller repeat protein [Halobaculum salinum]